MRFIKIAFNRNWKIWHFKFGNSFLSSGKLSKFPDSNGTGCISMQTHRKCNSEFLSWKGTLNLNEGNFSVFSNFNLIENSFKGLESSIFTWILMILLRKKMIRNYWIGLPSQIIKVIICQEINEKWRISSYFHITWRNWNGYPIFPQLRFIWLIC